MTDLLNNDDLLLGNFELKFDGDNIIGVEDIDFNSNFIIIKSKIANIEINHNLDFKNYIEYCNTLLKSTDEASSFLDLIQKNIKETSPLYMHQELLNSLNRILFIQNCRISNIKQCDEKKLTLQFVLAILLRIGERVSILKFLREEFTKLQIKINEMKIEKLKFTVPNSRKKKVLFLENIWNSSIKNILQEEIDFLKSISFLVEEKGKLAWIEKNNQKLIVE